MIEVEVETFLATLKDLKLTDGRARVVRHGHGPARTIQTGIGPGARARIRDRGTLREDPVQLGDPAAVGTADREFGRAVAGPLPARHDPSALQRTLFEYTVLGFIGSAAPIRGARSHYGLGAERLGFQI